MAKRKAVYDYDAQKKWADNNKSTRQRINRKSAARRFIREDAELDELQELQELINERRTNIMTSVDFHDESTIIAIAKECGWRDDAIERQLKTNGIAIYEPAEWVDEQRNFYADDEEHENWFENICVESWEDLLKKLESGKMGMIENGVENGKYRGRPFVMVTPL